MSEVERNKATIRALLEASDRGDVGAVRAFYGPEYVDHAAGSSRQRGDREGAIAAFRELAAAFPDVRHRVLDLIGEGDRVVLRVSATATHRAGIRGVEATGRPVSMTRTVIYRLRDGLIAERWLDGSESVVAQVRAVPDPGATDPKTGRRAQVVRADSAEWKGDSSGGSYWELGLADLSITCFRLEPGTCFPRHAHAAEQITVVLEGRLVFDVDGTRHDLGPGDAISIPSGVGHAVTSGEAPVLAIDAWSPPPLHLGSG